ncbi:hypothetical protein R69927_07819 [Paraburkholderia domus]|nr:hypothetical protein R69927_07819 [Paraburkholderia domus]
MNRLEQPLRVAMQFNDVLLVRLGQQPFERLFRPLPCVNLARLLPALVDRQHQTPVQQFLVDVDRGRRQHQHDRAFHTILLRHQVARRLVLARRCDRQFTIALQQLQCIRRLTYAFLFGNRQNLVLQVRLAQVEQALSGHGAVLDAFLVRHQVKHCIHQ